MATKRGTRRLTVVGLCLGLAATAAQAAPQRVPAWSGKALAAARLWLGLTGGTVPPTRAKSGEVTESTEGDVAGIFKLKQHVDNPGQTPMKDDGE